MPKPIFLKSEKLLLKNDGVQAIFRAPRLNITRKAARIKQCKLSPVLKRNNALASVCNNIDESHLYSRKQRCQSCEKAQGYCVPPRSSTTPMKSINPVIALPPRMPSFCAPWERNSKPISTLKTRYRLSNVFLQAFQK